MILALLATPGSLATSDKIQQGNLFGLIDAHDRKTTREEFIQIAETSFSLKDSLSRLHLLTAIDELYRTGALTQKKLDEAIEGLSRTLDRNRLNMYDLIHRVTQCPKTGDTVH